MAKETREKSFNDYQTEIRALKEKRLAAWRAQLEKIAPGDRVHDLPEAERRTAVMRAEAHPDVLAIDSEIRMLRAAQMANTEEPAADAETEE